MKLLAALFAAVILVTSCAASPVPEKDLCKASWIGSTDLSMLMQAKRDIEQAQAAACSVFVVELLSPGGPVPTSIEISHVIKRARAMGMEVEIHGRNFIASGGTVVLSAGTKGRRFITQNALVLVHGPQVGGACQGIIEKPKNDDEMALNQIIIQLATEYASNTGRSFVETYKWLSCDNTQVGDENLAIKLGLADHIDRL